MGKIIYTKNLFFEYEREEQQNVLVLNDINLEINQGEFVAVLGHNGSGKSTLSKHFNSILSPTKGEVFVNEINTKDEDKILDIRKNVGMVFQNPDNQIVATVVEEDVAFGLENLGVEPKEIRKRVDDALKHVEMYNFRLNAPHQLSGGQKQRVAIAGIIAMEPNCIILDEPTSMLDPRGRREVINTIKQLNKEKGVTIILITHYMDEAVQADRVIVIEKGDILLDGKPREVFSNIDKLKEISLDVPQSTELAYELNKAGFNIPIDLLNEQEFTEKLIELLEESNVNN